MTRRRWWLLALALALALTGVACGDDEGDTGSATQGGDQAKSLPPGSFPQGSTMASIQTRGKLIVGTKFDQPLYGQKNPTTGAIEGFDVEIAKLVAQKIFGGTLEEAARKIEFVETVSRVREPNIVEGKVDIVVATYTINDTRKQVVDFAGPYYIAGQDIMVRSDDTAVRSVADLNGKKVCSAQGSTSIKNVVQQAPQADISVSFDNYSKCAEALGDRRVDAVTTDDSILVGFVKDSNGRFKLVGRPFTREPYGIGLKKGDQAFRDFLNDRLEEIVANGEWAKAFERTVGTARVPTPQPPSVDRYTSAGATATTGGSGGTGSGSGSGSGSGATTTSSSTTSSTMATTSTIAKP